MCLLKAIYKYTITQNIQCENMCENANLTLSEYYIGL